MPLGKKGLPHQHVRDFSEQVACGLGRRQRWVPKNVYDATTGFRAFHEHQGLWFQPLLASMLQMIQRFHIHSDRHEKVEILLVVVSQLSSGR
jgi:hypothetical protein